MRHEKEVNMNVQLQQLHIEEIPGYLKARFNGANTTEEVERQFKLLAEKCKSTELTFCEGELHNLPSVFVIFDKKNSLFLSVKAHHTDIRSCSGVFFCDTPPPLEVKKISAKIGRKTGRCNSGVGMLITFK
jgi:hypothetical protein